MSTDLNLKVFVSVNVRFNWTALWPNICSKIEVELKKGSVLQVLGVHAELDKQRLIVNKLVGLIFFLWKFSHASSNYWTKLIHFCNLLMHLKCKATCQKKYEFSQYISTFDMLHEQTDRIASCTLEQPTGVFVCVVRLPFNANTFPHCLQSDTLEQ